MVDGSVKDLMESNGYKFVNIINELHTETYANDDMSIVFNNEKHTIELAITEIGDSLI